MSHASSHQLALLGLLGLRFQIGFLALGGLQGGIDLVGHAIDPHGRDSGSRIKESTAGFHHGEVGQFP